MYTAILRRVLSTYTIILRRVNRMKIFVYIRRWGSLVAQGIRGSHRSCFGTPKRNDNRNSVGSRGVYCTCLSTRNRYGVRGLYMFEHPKQERYCGENMEGDCQRWQEIEKICRILQR